MSNFEELLHMNNVSTALELRNNSNSIKCSHCIIDLEKDCSKPLSEVLNLNGTDNHNESITLYEALLQIVSIRLLLPGQVLNGSSSSSCDLLSRNSSSLCVCPNCEKLLLQLFISLQNFMNGNGNSLLVKICPQEVISSEILRKDEETQTDIEMEESGVTLTTKMEPIEWTELNIKEELNFIPGEDNYLGDDWSPPQSGQDEKPIVSEFQLQRYWEETPSSFKDQSPSTTKYSSKRNIKSLKTARKSNSSGVTGNGHKRQLRLQSNHKTIISQSPPKKPKVTSKDELIQKISQNRETLPSVQSEKSIVHSSEGRSTLNPDKSADLNSDPSFGEGKRIVLWPCSKSKCQNKFFQRSELEKHLIDWHMTGEEREIITARLDALPKGTGKNLCFEPGCEYISCKPSLLRAHHLAKHTPETEKETLRALWYTNICPEPGCGKRFQWFRELRLHKTTHPIQETEEISSKDSPNAHNRRLNKNFPCELCGRKFKFRRNQVKHHHKVHITIRLFICDICGKDFKTKKSLTHHGHFHKDSRDFECPAPNCKATYKLKQCIIRHLIQRHGLQRSHIKKWFENSTAVRLFEENTNTS